MEREPDSPVDADVTDTDADHDGAADDHVPDELDLDAVERDLADVERALDRLDDGSYWTDESTGEALPDELLAERPTARRRDP